MKLMLRDRIDDNVFRLENVYNYEGKCDDYSTLYELLKERTKKINISHRKLPTWKEHKAFVDSRPYTGWYYIIVDNEKVGAIYLTWGDEIGLFIFRRYRGKGFGSWALDKLLDGWPGVKKVYANINPKNEASIEFFKSKKFKLLQQTYVWTRKGS